MKRWIEKNMLWLVGVGLMLASSGIDGVYMAKWMPITLLGFILNTVADIADMVLAHKYGKLQRKKNPEKRKWAVLLLAGEICAIGYSWFFSWLQLRIVLKVIEPQDYKWIAPVAAGFIPVLLFFLGFAQALDDTSADLLETETKPMQVARKPDVVALQEPTDDQKIAQAKFQASTVAFIKEQVAEIAAQPVKLNDRQISVLEMLATQPDATYTAIGATHGVSRTTAKKDTETLISASQLRRNGHGWEVQR